MRTNDINCHSCHYCLSPTIHRFSVFSALKGYTDQWICKKNRGDRHIRFVSLFVWRGYEEILRRRWCEYFGRPSIAIRNNNQFNGLDWSLFVKHIYIQKQQLWPLAIDIQVDIEINWTFLSQASLYGSNKRVYCI